MVDILAALARRRWLVVFLAAMLGAGLGAVTVYATPASYSAKAMIYVTPPTSSSPTDAVMGDQYAQNRTELYLQLMKSDELAERVSDRLGSVTAASGLRARVTATSLHQAPILVFQTVGTSAEEARELAEAYVEELPDYARSVERNSGVREGPLMVTVAAPVDVESSVSGWRPPARIGGAAVVAAVLAFGLLSWFRRRHPTVRKADDLRTSLPSVYVTETTDSPTDLRRMQVVLFTGPKATRRLLVAGPRRSPAPGTYCAAMVGSLSDRGIDATDVTAAELLDGFDIGSHATELVLIQADSVLEAGHLVPAIAARCPTAVIVAHRNHTYLADVIELHKLLGANGIEVRAVVILRKVKGFAAPAKARAEDDPWPTIDVLEAELAGSARGGGDG